MEKLTKFIPTSVYGKATLAVTLIQAIVVICLESAVAAIFLPTYDKLESTPLKGIPVYLMIFVSSQAFQVFLCWDAIFHQNTIQIIGFVIFNGCCFMYSIFQYSQIILALDNPAFPASSQFSMSEVSGYLISIIVITGLSVLIISGLAYKLYLEFGWKIYKKIGADPRMKKMYRVYQVFLMILKLDFFFFMAFSIQFLVLVLNTADPEFALTIVALPCTAFVIFTAVYGLRNENYKIMGVFLTGCLCAMSYFIFKIARIHQPSQKYKYEFTEKFLTFFASLSLLVVSLTLINAVVCISNFGKGLKQHIATSKKESAAAAAPKSTEDRKMTLAE